MTDIAAKALGKRWPQILLRRPGHPWLLAAGFAVLVIMCGVSVWLFDEAKRDAGLIARTISVEAQLSEIQLLMHRATSSQYGFIVTESRAYLDLYQHAVDEFPKAHAALRDLISDNPAQIARLEQLEPLMDARMKELQEPVALALDGRRDAALELQRTTDNPSLSLSIVGLIDQMRAEEDTLLDDRQRAARNTRLWLLAVSLTGATMIVFLATISIADVRRSAALQREAQKLLETANVKLEEKVQERTAALQSANQEVQRFAYIVSHDLRSPLVNIMGFTSELEASRQDLIDRLKASDAPAKLVEDIEGGPVKDFDESLEFIKAAIGKMDRLINAILRLSRVGYQEFRPAPVDLGAVIQTIRSTLGHQIQTADAVVDIKPLPTITTDRLAVEQVFSNLLDNALKYLRPGVKGEIEVSATERGNFVVVRVADNGCGIDLKDRERIFELFRRSGQQDRPGEGIGLAHVRMLVRRLGGRISVESEVGKGSVFTVILPKTLVLEG